MNRRRFLRNAAGLLVPTLAPSMARAGLIAIVGSRHFTVPGGGGDLVHGQASVITGSGFGTRADYNFGDYEWQGVRHIHWRWGDFAAGFPANGSSQATTEAQLKGFFCGATGLGSGAFDYNDTPSSVGVAIVDGGPSQSGKMLRKTNIGGGSAEEGYIQFNTTGSLPSTPLGFTCFKAKCVDVAGGGKVMRYWKQGGGNPNHYIGNNAGGTITKEPGPQFTFLDNYGDPEAAFRRYQWVYDTDSTLSINGTAMINSSTDTGFCVAGQTTTKVMSGATFQDAHLTWPNSCDAGAVYEYADIYFDPTPARVAVTDGIKTEIQICTSWSDTEIETLFNKGELSSGPGTRYAYNTSNALVKTESVTIA